MACVPTTTTSIPLQKHKQNYLVFNPTLSNFTTSFFFFPSSFNLSRSSSLHLRPSFCGPPPFNLHRPSYLCRAGTPGPPLPPPGNEPHNTSITTSFSRLWDTMQIFFAVFFWMSLFFWASASDRKKPGGRNKGNPFGK